MNSQPAPDPHRKKPDRRRSRRDSAATDDFLDDSANSLRKTKSKMSIVKKISSDLIRDDVENLNATELKKKYKCEYNSHKNMKQRVKKTGGIVAPEFGPFSSFLLCMEAIPYKGHTLDRIDNTNPDYTPDNCQWADKADQANNRSNTKLLTHNGEELPAATWARRMGVKLNTIHSRLARRWTHSEAITGKRERSGKAPPPMPWTGSKRKQIKLEQRYQQDYDKGLYTDRYEAYIEYIIQDGHEDFEALRDCHFGRFLHIPRPQMDAIHRRHQRRTGRIRELEEEYADWKSSQLKPTAKGEMSVDEKIWADITAARDRAQSREGKDR